MAITELRKVIMTGLPASWKLFLVDVGGLKTSKWSSNKS